MWKRPARGRQNYSLPNLSLHSVQGRKGMLSAHGAKTDSQKSSALLLIHLNTVKKNFSCILSLTLDFVPKIFSQQFPKQYGLLSCLLALKEMFQTAVVLEIEKVRPCTT